jgi:biopolymer transport protein ExbB/TolQ
LVKPGTFVLVGPAAVFRSKDGTIIGTVDPRLDSIEPAVIPFANPADAEAAAQLITESKGVFPLDPTLGNAHKIEETKETLLEHIKKGGPVMYPIFALAGAALLVAMLKWLSMILIRTPSQKRIRALLGSVAQRDKEGALQKATAMRGPVGKMLTVGVEHLEEPRELIEEVMYEKILATRLKLQRFLPFIAISAASAPLLGLLGTVTGIINTFKLITVFGTGDVKTLSAGISEALITTEFGLIVAIPSLLLHAFLSRKARGVVNQMEKAAVALVNQVGKTPYRPTGTTDVLPKPTAYPIESPAGRTGSREQVVRNEPIEQYSDDSAGSLMDRRTVSVNETATVAEAVRQIQSARAGEDMDTLFVVGEEGKYMGRILIRDLMAQPEGAQVESIADSESLFVRVDTHAREVETLFNKHNVITIPVLDRNDQLVGRITRNGNRNGNGGEK